VINSGKKKQVNAKRILSIAKRNLTHSLSLKKPHRRFLPHEAPPVGRPINGEVGHLWSVARRDGENNAWVLVNPLRLNHNLSFIQQECDQLRSAGDIDKSKINEYVPVVFISRSCVKVVLTDVEVSHKNGYLIAKV
jgi:hypothetical protein